jgi:hypothetical protein
MENYSFSLRNGSTKVFFNGAYVLSDRLQALNNAGTAVDQNRIAGLKALGGLTNIANGGYTILTGNN